MQEVIAKFEATRHKQSLPVVRTGDSVRVHQKVKESGRERVQMFEGMVIRTRKRNSLQAAITVRKVASGVGVEKIFPLHSPSITKIEVLKHSRVRRNYLTYIRQRAGRAAKLRERAEREAERLARLEHEQADKTSVQKTEEETGDKDKSRAAKPHAAGKKDVKANKPTEPSAQDAEQTAEAKKDQATRAKTKKEKAEEFRQGQAAKQK